MANKKNPTIKPKRKPKTPLRVILMRILALILAFMMVISVAYFILIPNFSETLPELTNIISAEIL